MVDSPQWLVRKRLATDEPSVSSRRLILGPYFAAQVQAMLSGGELEPDDELCPENGFWFPPYDTVELRRWFGEEMPEFGRPVMPGSDQEITQPDFATLPGEGTSLLKLHRPSRMASPAGSAPDKGPKYPRLDAPRPAARPTHSDGDRPDPASIGLEKGRLLGLFMVLSLALSLAGFLWVIKALRQ